MSHGLPDGSEKYVAVMGAKVVQQCLPAGLLDELVMSLGAGRARARRPLDLVRVLDAPASRISPIKS